MATVSKNYIYFGQSDSEIIILLRHISTIKFDKTTELLTITTTDGATNQIKDTNGNVYKKILRMLSDIKY